MANAKVGQECVAHGASELHVHSEHGQLPRKAGLREREGMCGPAEMPIDEKRP